MPKVVFQNTEVVLYNDATLYFEGTCRLESRGIHLVIGPNGAGKTILLHVLARLLHGHESGPVRAIGNRVEVQLGVPTDEGIGWLRQDPRENFVAKFSADEIILPLLNPAFTKSEMEARIDKLLAALGVISSDVLERAIDRLSAGQQQALGAAAALSPKPKLVVLDEPYARLDFPRSAQLSQLLLEASKDAILILTTHKPEQLIAQWDSHLDVITCVSRDGSLVRIEQQSLDGWREENDSRDGGLPYGHMEVVYGNSVPKGTEAGMTWCPAQGDVVADIESITVKAGAEIISRVRDLQLREGISLLIGRNGSGKTTCGLVLAGVWPLNPLWVLGRKRIAEGKVSFSDADWDSFSSLRRRGLSVFAPGVPDKWLPECTVTELLSRFHAAGDASLDEILDKAQIQPQQRISELSFGQRRLCLLLSLPKQLELVILDEPFADMSRNMCQFICNFVGTRATSGDWRCVVLLGVEDSPKEPEKAARNVSR